jgi:hypothetical protein
MTDDFMMMVVELYFFDLPFDVVLIIHAKLVAF